MGDRRSSLLQILLCLQFPSASDRLAIGTVGNGSPVTFEWHQIAHPDIKMNDWKKYVSTYRCKQRGRGEFLRDCIMGQGMLRAKVVSVIGLD